MLLRYRRRPMVAGEDAGRAARKTELIRATVREMQPREEKDHARAACTVASDDRNHCAKAQFAYAIKRLVALAN